MNVKAIRMNALSRLELSAQKHKPVLKDKDSLKGHKQTTALKLLEREEENARRSRMLSLLTQQYIGKYGSKAPTSRINAFIKATVSDFLNSYSNMTVAESMLESLESQIREITDHMKNDINKQRTDSRQEQLLLKQQEQLQLKLAQQQKNQGGSGSRRNSESNLGVNANGSLEPTWAMLNAISAAEAEMKEAKQKELSIQRAKKYKNDLDSQKNALQSISNRDDIDKREQHEINLRVAAEYEKDLQEKANAKKLKGAKEREMRMAQIEYNDKLRQKERQMKIMAEQADMARSRRLAEAEAEAAQAKKDASALAMEKVKAENEENKRLKEIAKQKQWDYEAKLNKDYEAKLEKEEQARVKAFNDRVDALKRFEKSGAGAAAEAAKAQTMEMEKTLAEIEAKYQKDADAAEQKRLQRQQDMIASRQFNMTLIERKKQQKELERQADADRRRQQQIELEAEQAREQQKKMNKLKTMNELKSKLDEQVERRHRESQLGKVTLTDEEKEYNQKIIKKLQADPKLYQQVMQRVNPTPRGGLNEFKYG